MSLSSVRRARRSWAGLVSAAVTVALVGTAGSAQAATTPAGHASDWLAGQLHHGVIHNGQYDFDDYGLTSDVVLALTATGFHPDAVAQARTALAKHVTDYTGPKKERYAGALAKLLVVTEQTGGGSRDFGGVDLVHRLSQRVSQSAPTVGRISDRSKYGDNANVVGQIFAARGLVQVGASASQDALKFLLRQQCQAGYLRLDFTKSKTSSHQGCTRTSPADVDTTALFVIELSAVQASSPDLPQALTKAKRWLLKHQHADGSFSGGPTTAPKNSNSTGLAGWALAVQHRCGAARDAAHWVRGKQVTGKSGARLSDEKGAIAYDGTALKAAKKHGITQSARDQWRRATAQAAPLLALPGCVV
ncbi:MAG TPA: hypothetical protein VFJ89_01260 [Nocardioides sp.]|jgi:hypothetical protein|nr:hypothetical protein [Nocardioides sp.]